MTATPSDTVCVIVAAKDAAGTIARAVTSALAQPEVAEVIVVDDGSTDGTHLAAEAAAAGDGRLKVIRLAKNLGPAGARNRALEATASALVCILDADDFMLDGRIGRMLARFDNCDMLADDLFYTNDPDGPVKPRGLFQLAEGDEEFLSFERFVEGNISRPGKARGELGFLKPLMRRAFLVDHGLSYDPTLRLGEDFALYSHALALGARFKALPACGYVSVVRSDSLSGSHSIADLAALCAFDGALPARVRLTPEQSRVLARHERALQVKLAHRQVLQAKSEGRYGEVAAILMDPRRGPGVVAAILRDKLAG